MDMSKQVVIGVLVFLLIVTGIAYLNKAKFIPVEASPTPYSSAPSKYDDFAKCLNEKGVKMYGAFWCGHCKNQKEAFGSSFQYVNYQECTVGGNQNSFAQECKDADIKGYPTWKFPNGTIKEGEVSFADLAKLSGCTLPQ